MAHTTPELQLRRTRIFKLQGKSEEDSINIAIARFGEVDVLKNQLKEIYNVQKSFSKKLLNIALVLIFIGTISLISQFIYYSSNNIDSKLLNNIENTIKNDNGISDKKLKSLFHNNNKKFRFYNKELKYIAVFKYPKNYSGTNDSFKHAQYIYPSIEELNNDLVRIRYIANASSDKEYLDNNNKWHISVCYITPRAQWREYGINTVLRIFTITCIVSSLVLFMISTFINIHHNKRVNFI